VTGILPLPPGLDTFDAKVEALWAPLRGNPIVDRLLYAASEVGDFGMIWMLIVAIPALSGKPKEGRELYRLAGALAVESLIVNQGLKRVFKRERPLVAQRRPHAVRQPSTHSFPSGHSTSAMTAAILLSETKVLPRSVIAITAGIVAGSRIHVKMHHPSDVVAGLSVGAAMGWIIRRWYRVT
jgi:undecaprenyl-diphosphatase